MALRILALFGVALVAISIGCGDPATTEPTKACYLTPDLPECSCDDENPCTIDTRQFDGCKYDYVTYGDPCIGQEGFCDVGAVCRQECDNAPCLDWTVQLGYGCVYSVRQNGWTCTDEIGDSGICDHGSCIVPMTPTDACKWHGEDAPCSYGTTNGVCRSGVCVPRDGACVAQETKCSTAEIPAGWCGTWEWPTDPTPELYCKSCMEIECGGVPGCSAVGDVCQGGDGDGGCPPGCCPLCY